MGLVLHNVAMAQLWELGLRGTRLDVAAAWKEALLLVALLVVAWKVRRLPSVTAYGRAGGELRGRDRRLLADAGRAGRRATARGELLALRHHLFPVAGFHALGRLVAVAWQTVAESEGWSCYRRSS